MADYKIAIEYNIYNEEQFIKDVLLTTAKRLKGVDFMYILDGSWKYSGGEAQSTDRTKEIIERIGPIIKERWKMEFYFSFFDFVFRTQGEKRNLCLKIVEDKMKERDPNANWYHLILDGDEFIQFTSGLYDIWLNKEGAGVDQIWPKLGLLAAYAERSSKKLLSPRFIPAFQGYHYHTEQRMVIHDKDCVPIVDYNPKKRSYAKKMTKEITQFFILNKWNIRNIDRALTKTAYNSATYPNKLGQCQFNSLNSIRQTK